jgi:hypothetical protein
MTTQYNDPFDAASDPQLPTFDVWGQARTLAYFCVLQKGVGAVDFDPQQHKVEDRRTNITIEVVPLSDSGSNFSTQRRMLRESREWAAVVWPSLKGLGVNNLRDIDGVWVHTEMAPTGRTYENKNGETVPATTFKFLHIFPDEAACRAAYLAEHPEKENGSAQAQAIAPAAQAPAATTPPPANQNEKAVALRLVGALIRKVSGDEQALAAQMATMPVVSRHFTITSKEVREALDAYLFEAMGKAA